MVTKKDGTKKGAGGSRAVRDLAGMISAVIAHPDTPPELRSHIRYGLSETFNELPDANRLTDVHEYIALLLAERGKGARSDDTQGSRADHIARVVMHPETPAALKNALQATIVNIVANASGYG